MSFALLKAVFNNDAGKVTGSRLLLLLCLANFANDDGECWPPKSQIMAMTGFTDRTFRKTLSELEALGAVKVTHIAGRGIKYALSLPTAEEQGLLKGRDCQIAETAKRQRHPLPKSSGGDCQKTVGGLLKDSPNLSITYQVTNQEPTNNSSPPFDDVDEVEFDRDVPFEEMPFPDNEWFGLEEEQPTRQKKQKTEDRIPCPYEKIRELFNNTVQGLPQVQRMTEPRKKMIRARWLEEIKANNLQTEEQALNHFEAFFKRVQASNFLTGRTNSNGRSFAASFDWIFKESNYVKITEGNYDNNGQSTGGSLRSGNSRFDRPDDEYNVDLLGATFARG